jgi:hypothetical protein
VPLYQAWYRGGVWSVVYLREAESELGELPPTEQVAIRNAVEKLKALGPELRFPHSSKAMGADDLRELRPRAGRCAWRALYRRIGNTFVNRGDRAGWRLRSRRVRGGVLQGRAAACEGGGRLGPLVVN